MTDFPGLEPNLGRQLEASLDATGVADTWQVQSIGEAEWAVEKLRNAQARVRMLNDQHAEWTARVDDWYSRAVEPLVRTTEFFSRHLQDYALAVRAETGAKTLSLPSGKVSTRQTADRVVVEDAEAFIVWARDYAPEALRVETKVDTAGLKAGPWAPWYPDGPDGVCRVIDKTTGEVVPGLAWQDGHVTATVEVQP